VDGDVEVSQRDEYEKGTTIERACRKRWWSFSLLSYVLIDQMLNEVLAAKGGSSQAVEIVR
jgi:hypothetical protein